MTIRFTCSNPACGRPVRAADTAAGKRARCPYCGTIGPVPAQREEPADDPVKVDDLAGLEGGEAVETPTRPPPRRRRRGHVTCGKCRRRFAADALLCPFCSWVNPESDPSDRPEAGDAVPIESAGSFAQFAAGCLTSVGYSAKHFGNLLAFIMWWYCMLLLLGVPLALLGWGVIRSGQGTIAFVLLYLVLNMASYGYFLRFHLDATSASLDGTDKIPELPRLQIPMLFVAGLKSLAILLVYALPVVTIPLLPLGLLALARTNDLRAFNVVRAARAAVKGPGHLAFLWIVLVLLGGLMLPAVAVVYLALADLLPAVTLPGWTGVGVRALIVILGIAAILTVVCVFTVAQFRCVGLLGRYCPQMAGMVSRRSSPLAGLGCLCGGLALSVLILQGPVTRGARQVERWSQAKAQVLKAMADLNELSTALHLYAMEHRDSFPPTLKALVQQKYISQAQLRSRSDPPRRHVYLTDQSTRKPASNILLYDPAEYEGGQRVVLLVGGEVQVLPSTGELNKRLAAQGSPLDGSAQPERTP